jgi:rhomboid protease GluP
MSNYGIKIRHIMPVFLYVTLGTILGLALLRYFFAIQVELLNFKQEIWEIWIPLAFPWIPITIWLRPKLRILIFRKDSDRKQFGFQLLTWFTMAGSLVVSQLYLTTASGSIQDTADIIELDQKEPTRYYRIKSFQTLTSSGSSSADVRASGKHNQYLDIHIFFVCPIVKDSVHHEPKTLKYWYGVSFKKQISNRLSSGEKEKEYNDFYTNCIEEMNHYAFHDLTYFERLPNTEDRDGYLKAVANITKDTEKSAVILEAKHVPFEKRSGNKFAWIFGSYFIGLTVFLLMLAWPRLSKMELDRQLAGRKPKEDHVINMFKFLIPKEPHFVTSVILDLNILVFVVMMVSGVHIMSPNGLELLEWGANRRLETTSGDWWRLLTSMFLHGGIMHLILNIYGLVLASIFIEPMLGSVRYAIIYFVSGLAGSAASIWWYDNTISVGASGAIFGLCGAILAVVLTGILNKEGKKLILMLFGPYVLINLLMGLVGGIDNAAHIGGLLCGAVVALIIYVTFKPKANEDTSHQ